MKTISSFTISALFLFGCPSFAQMEALEEGGLRVSTNPEAQYHTLNLDTGVIRDTHPSAIDSLEMPATFGACYSNSVDNDGALDALVFPATDEIFDWGIKGCGGSKLVEKLTIGYASFAVPTIQGGPGGSLTIRLYQQAFGFGFYGTEMATLSLTGLPSDTGMPILIPRFLTIELGSQSFYLPDGPLGWSYENSDGSSGPLLVDATIPLGVQNYIDVYRPGPAKNGNYLGTFMFPPGGVSNDPFENSFWMELHQNETQSSAVAIQAIPNPPAFSSPDGPVVGSVWNSICLNPTTDVFTFVVLALQDFSGPATPFGFYVIDLTTRIGPISIAANDVHSYSIPFDTSLIGANFYAQGGFTTPSGSGLQLTNGLELTIGAF